MQRNNLEIHVQYKNGIENDFTHVINPSFTLSLQIFFSLSLLLPISKMVVTFS